MRYIVPNRKDFNEEMWTLLREAFGKARPAATMVVAGLMEEDMLIEIEVTARRRAVGGKEWEVERVQLY